MNLGNLKSIIGIFVLFAFIYAGVLGLLLFSHAGGMPMANCPYSANGYSVCGSNLNHVDNWQKFLNLTLPVLLVFLSTAGVLYFTSLDDFFDTTFRFRKLEKEKLYSPRHAIIRWLSLLENSPSLIGVRV